MTDTGLTIPVRILLIEDDELTAQTIVRSLREAQWEVHWEASGLTGLRQAQLGSWDILILDQMLPGLDGPEILRQLRKSNHRGIVIFLTARDRIEDRVQGLEMGADNYLVKPFSLAELHATLRSHLRRWGQFTNNIASDTRNVVGPLTFDPILRVAWREKKRIELTPKECDLLSYMISRAETVVPKAMLAREVWGLHFGAGSNLVEVHMRKLRAKLDDPFDWRLLQTVRGVGYKLSTTKEEPLED